MRFKSVVGLAMIGFALLPDVNAAESLGPGWSIEARIPLGDVSGRIDHLTYDPGRQRLYVAELGNNSVGIVDLKVGRVLRTVKGFEEPQGIASKTGSDAIYVANGGNGAVGVFKAEDFSVLGSIDMGSDADNVRVDPDAHRVYVGYGGGAIAVIDAQTRKRIANMPLTGHPESFQLGPDRNLIYANIPDAHHVAVLSQHTNRQIADWPTGAIRSNFPMAIDAERDRVISLFRSPPRLQSFVISTGKVAESIEVCSDADDVFVDARRHRYYLVCGEGVVESRDASVAGLPLLGRLTTSSGSRTGLFLPDLDRLVVAVRANGGESAAIWVLRPAP